MSKKYKRCQYCKEYIKGDGFYDEELKMFFKNELYRDFYNEELQAKRKLFPYIKSMYYTSMSTPMSNKVKRRFTKLAEMGYSYRAMFRSVVELDTIIKAGLSKGYFPTDDSVFRYISRVVENNITNMEALENIYKKRREYMYHAQIEEAKARVRELNRINNKEKRIRELQAKKEKKEPIKIIKKKPISRDISDYL